MPLILSDALSIVFALALYALNRRHGTPWLVAAAFMAAQAAAMWFAPSVPALGPMFAAYARIPLGLTACNCSRPWRGDWLSSEGEAAFGEFAPAKCALAACDQTR